MGTPSWLGLGATGFERYRTEKAMDGVGEIVGFCARVGAASSIVEAFFCGGWNEVSGQGEGVSNWFKWLLHAAADPEESREVDAGGSG
jgi:hypothetical protein